MTDNHTHKSSTALADKGEAEGKPAEAETVETASTGDAPKVKDARRPASISVRSLLIAVIVIILACAVSVLAWLYIGAEGKLDAQAQQSANNKRAEEVALDYAVNAAVMNFQDLGTWKTKLVAGTSPELKEKLTKAADSMEQILMPLQWNSTAKPLVAKVRSDSGGVYVVDSFVSVLTKTTQAPDGLQSTATYSITMDGNNNWQITDVGGIDAVMPQG